MLTNGLAANDHPLVYGGYAPVRKPLPREGVGFFELRGDLVVDGTKEAGAADADSKLHGKAFIVDRRYAYVGYFNWDPRSVDIDTEMGDVVDSPEFASAMAESVYGAIPENAYNLTLNDGRRLQWETVEEGERRIFT